MQKLLFRQTLIKHRLDEIMRETGVVIVAFSGGADSSCLLRLMNEWCLEHKVELHAAHVNHMIRGEEADRDEEFCRSVCCQLDIKFHVLRADVPALAKEQGRGLEETARAVRYEFFDDVSEKLTGKKDGAIIATAHNASDNLETVIFNMLRGCGIHGLCGIDPLRDGRFIRPLICDSGDSIRQWCLENDVQFVTDHTNEETEYTRNRIRHNIVPEMRYITADPEGAIRRMVDLLRIDDGYLSSVAEAYLEPGCTEISRDTLKDLHPAIASRILRTMYAGAKDGNATLGEVHVRNLLDLISYTDGEAELSLPGKINALIDRRSVKFIRSEELENTSVPVGTVFQYPRDGDVFENELCKVTFSLTEHNNHNNNCNKYENIYKLSILTSLSFDKIKGVLKIEYRREGDIYFYGGLTRKVKKLLGDKKLSSREKALLPIFRDDDGIVWIPGFPPRDGMKDCGSAPLYITCQFLNEINIR